jgi:MoxR-like ATPase
MSETTWRVYGRAGTAGASAGNGVPVLPRSVRAPDDPAGYLPDAGLVDAVNVAIALGQPLLLTGEPGTGKTQLAHSVAYQLFGPGVTPIVFNTKTTSTARDLFYQYDALTHFRDAQLRPAGQQLLVDEYITYQALGLAILIAMPREQVAGVLPPAYQARGRSRSVVLIDEIDKAPRDLPNDVLNEIEAMSFQVKETGQRFAAELEYRPIVIMTSNSEKLLPEPFLRRCVFFHLEFPDTDQLRRIVERRLGGDGERPGPTRAWVGDAIGLFEKIRSQLKRKPATAELLAWIQVLDRLSTDAGGKDPLETQELASTYPVLAKYKDDLLLLAKRGPRLS